jgi:hypothetical protein
MNQLSQLELDRSEVDRKIHTFMKRKMHEFPELTNDHYTTERAEPKEHDRVRRHHLFPSMRFGAQY